MYMKMAEPNTGDTIIKDKILQDQTDNVAPPCKNPFFAVIFYFHFHPFPVGNEGFVPFPIHTDRFCPCRFCC